MILIHLQTESQCSIPQYNNYISRPTRVGNMLLEMELTEFFRMNSIYGIITHLFRGWKLSFSKFESNNPNLHFCRGHIQVLQTVWLAYIVTKVKSKDVNSIDK